MAQNINQNTASRAELDRIPAIGRKALEHLRENATV
jgi:DNA uptake protein ComE-like DNA-binding protein